MGAQQITVDYTSLDPNCVGERYWHTFFISSLITFLGGLILILFWRFIYYILFGKFRRKFKQKFVNLKKNSYRK